HARKCEPVSETRAGARQPEPFEDGAGVAADRAAERAGPSEEGRHVSTQAGHRAENWKWQRRWERSGAPREADNTHDQFRSDATATRADEGALLHGRVSRGRGCG